MIEDERGRELRGASSGIDGIDLFRKIYGLEPNNLQKTVLTEVRRGASYIIDAPTSSGKSTVSKILHKVLGYDGVIYLLPTRAATYNLRKEYADAGIGSSIVVNMDFPATEKRIMSTEAVFATYHKFIHYVTEILRLDRDFFRKRLIVADDLNDLSLTIDAMLTLIRMLGGQIIVPNATFSREDISAISQWLGAKVISVQGSRDIDIVYRVVEVSPGRDISEPPYRVESGEFAGRYSSIEDLVASMVESIIKRERNASILIYAPSTFKADSIARAVSSRLPPRPVSAKLVLSSESDRTLRDTIRRGVGIYHIKISQVNRKIIDDLSSKGQLPVIVSIMMYVYSINKPFDHLIITDPVLPNQMMMDPTTFHQLAGRVGRTGKATKGIVYVIADTESKKSYIENLVKIPAAPISYQGISDVELESVCLMLTYILRSTARVESVLRNMFYSIKFSPSKLVDGYRSMVEEWVDNGYIEIDEHTARTSFTEKKYWIAAAMAMPLEMAESLSSMLSSRASYDEILNLAVGYAVREMKPRYGDIDSDTIEKVRTYGLLVHVLEEHSLKLKDLADLTARWLDAFTIYARRLFGYRSSEYRHAVEMRDSMEYGGEEGKKMFKDILDDRSIPNYAKKSFIRNFAPAALKHGCVDPDRVIEYLTLNHKRIPAWARTLRRHLENYSCS